MTKAKLDEYLNKSVIATLKNGEKIIGRVRKIKNVYIIGKDIELIPSSVKKVEIKQTDSGKVKVLERTKIEEHFYKERCVIVKTKNEFTRYVVRYGHINGKNVNLVKSFSSLEQAKEFNEVCKRNINEMKFAKNSVMEIKNCCEILEYPETLLKALGIEPNNFENYYNEIVPNFDENFKKLSFDTLNDREERMLVAYFKEKMNFAEIGRNEGLTRERVRQIVAKAVRKLRHSRAINILTTSLHQYELINAQEREELYLKIKREMTYELALQIIKEHDELEQQYIASNQKNWSIDELDLSVRSHNCLKRAGIATIGELIEHTEEDMKKVKNLGKKSLKELREKLAEIGLGFKVCEDE